MYDVQPFLGFLRERQGEEHAEWKNGLIRMLSTNMILKWITTLNTRPKSSSRPRAQHRMATRVTQTWRHQTPQSVNTLYHYETRCTVCTHRGTVVDIVHCARLRPPSFCSFAVVAVLFIHLPSQRPLLQLRAILIIPKAHPK